MNSLACHTLQNRYCIAQPVLPRLANANSKLAATKKRKNVVTMSAPGITELIRESLVAVSQGQMPAMEVLKPLISKGLGYAILAGACITKLPQILNIMRSKSAEGLSIISFELEIVGFLIASSYGYIMGLPFSAYGEATILLLQSIFLVVLVYKYAKVPAARALTTTALFTGAASFLLSGNVSRDLIQVLYLADNLVFMGAKVPQIVSNFRTRATGQLSLATNAINLLGCLVRIFTTIQEKAGLAMLCGFTIGTCLNLTIVLQILAYGPKKPKAKLA